MRRLLYILLLFSFSAEAQFVKGTFVSGTGYSSFNNYRFVYMEHIVGTGNPCIVYVAGIDHRGPPSTGPTDYSTSDIIKNKGVAKMVASAPMNPFYVPGTTTTKRWNVFTVQVPNTTGTVPEAAVAELIKQRIIAAHGSDVDTNTIMYVGYSLGAGGGMYQSRSIFSLPRITSFHLLASGYNASPNYPLTAASGAPIYVYHSAADPTAPVSVSDGYVNGLNAQKSLWPVQYKRFSDLTGTPTNDHDRIRFIMEDTTRALSFALTNGDTWAYTELIYETGLRFKRQRMTR